MKKIEAAKILLTTTTLPVTLISENVGYGNYSNFTYTFHQIVGCTPTEYRQKQEQMGAAYKKWAALIYMCRKSNRNDQIFDSFEKKSFV